MLCHTERKDKVYSADFLQFLTIINSIRFLQVYAVFGEVYNIVNEFHKQLPGKKKYL